MDQRLNGLPITYTFIDETFVVTKITAAKHWLTVKKILESFDNSNIRPKLDKCQFAETYAEWLGSH